MSFIRFGEQGSSVYVYPGSYSSGREYFDCCGCSLIEESRLDTKAEMHQHLLAHLAAGHVVPEKAFDELEAWDADVAALLGEWADAGRGKEFATYEEAWIAAADEVADLEARRHGIAERITEQFADVLPPGARFVFDDSPMEGDL